MYFVTHRRVKVRTTRLYSRNIEFSFFWRKLYVCVLYFFTNSTKNSPPWQNVDDKQYYYTWWFSKNTHFCFRL